MENSAEAIKIAAAILFFVGAISLALTGLTRARQAAGDLLTKTDPPYYDTENISISNNRIVGIESIIPTMYAYFKEGYTILFYKGNYNEVTDELTDIEELPLYETEALDSLLNLSTIAIKDPLKRNTRKIYGIDTNDEHTRQEPWLTNEIQAKYFIESLINNTPEISQYVWSRPVFFGSKNSYDETNHKLTMYFNLSGGLVETLGRTSIESY